MSDVLFALLMSLHKIGFLIQSSYNKMFKCLYCPQDINGVMACIAE